MLSTSTPIGVIGSGAMGAGIAQVAASAGHPVYLYDTSSDQLTKAGQNLQVTLQKLVEKNKLPEEEAQTIQQRIRYVNTLKEFAACKLVIEAIVERLDVKQQVFSELETIVTTDCIVASNTSSLSITLIAAACKNPERVMGIHFFNPAPLMPLVEIIPGVATDLPLLRAAQTLITGWGKSVVLAKDTPGFIVNRVARPYYGESIRIYEEGIADFATIDWALKVKGGFRMGPFELMDFIGNDINYKVTETVWEQFFYEPRFKPSFTQKRLFEAKRFGRKTGRGYYDYRPNAPFPAPQEDLNLAQLILDRVLAMLINEAAEALYLGIATRDDLDIAMTRGVNYPRGLLKWADEIGISNVLNTLENLYLEYNEDRYRPCVLLKRMVREGKTFY